MPKKELDINLNTGSKLPTFSIWQVFDIATRVLVRDSHLISTSTIFLRNAIIFELQNDQQ
jgi:hypothetical protein